MSGYQPSSGWVGQSGEWRQLARRGAARWLYSARQCERSSRRHEGSRLIRRLILVAFYIEVGLLLIVLPWSGFWERNYFVQTWRWLQPIITDHSVRGGISGLGVVNLFAGFFELASMFSRGDRHDVAMTDGADTKARL